VGHADVLHANGPPGQATSAEVLDEVNNDKSDDFADFNDDEDASDPAEEQRTLLSLFETDCHDRAAHGRRAASSPRGQGHVAACPPGYR
jgi:hypothetical protein